MAKLVNTELVGYIVGVSPMKKNKSFNVQVQTERNCKPKKAICFDTTKHEIFSLKKVSGDAVKVKNVVFQEENLNNNLAPYVINNCCTVDDVDPITYHLAERNQKSNLSS